VVLPVSRGTESVFAVLSCSLHGCMIPGVDKVDPGASRIVEVVVVVVVAVNSNRAGRHCPHSRRLARHHSHSWNVRHHLKPLLHQRTLPPLTYLTFPISTAKKNPNLSNLRGNEQLLPDKHNSIIACRFCCNLYDCPSSTIRRCPVCLLVQVVNPPATTTAAAITTKQKQQLHSAPRKQQRAGDKRALPEFGRLTIPSLHLLPDYSINYQLPIPITTAPNQYQTGATADKRIWERRGFFLLFLLLARFASSRYPAGSEAMCRRFLCD